MFTFLLIVQTLVAATLVGTILMQRSEGGGLGVGGSSAGLMTARGAADFLTAMFIILSIALAGIAGVSRQAATVDTSLAKEQPFQPVSQTPVQPTAPATAPTGNETAPAVPLAQ